MTLLLGLLILFGFIHLLLQLLLQQLLVLSSLCTVEEIQVMQAVHLQRSLMNLELHKMTSSNSVIDRILPLQPS